MQEPIKPRDALNRLLNRQIGVPAFGVFTDSLN